jgi:hypothetical protein
MMASVFRGTFTLTLCLRPGFMRHFADPLTMTEM